MVTSENPFMQIILETGMKRSVHLLYVDISLANPVLGAKWTRHFEYLNLDRPERKQHYVIIASLFLILVMAQTPLRYTGHLHLRTRLVLSILSGKPVRIDGIRSNDKDPGLRGAV